MVMGWSGSFLGLAFFALPIISCLSALPLEVTSRLIRIISGMSGTGGVVVPWPSQVPARVLSLSKDFCASDCGALDWAEGLCDSAWAKAMAESDNIATESRM